MPRITPIAFTLALPISFISQVALADLTPSQVWGDWRQYMEGMGYKISATETANGADLTLADVVLQFGVPDSAGAVSISFGSVRYLQNADGTVAIETPANLPLQITAEPAVPGDDGFTMNLMLTQSGHSHLAAGSPQEITYSYTADTLTVNLQELRVGAETFGADNARIAVSGTGISSQTTMSNAQNRAYAQTGSTANITYEMFINNPEQTSEVVLSGSAQNMAWDGSGTIPTAVDITNANMGAMIRAGFDVLGSVTYGGGTTTMDVSDPVNGNFALKSSSGGGELGVKIGAKGVSYNGTQQDLNMTVNVDGLPFPISLNLAKSGFNLSAPVLKSADEQDFAFGLLLSDFTMSDMIWGIFDPTGQLPRDPATIELSTSGRALLDIDYMDPEAIQSMGAGGPGEIRALNIATLLVDAAGAVLQGTGDLTFDNTDKTTIPGVPRPTGTVDLSLAGANGLLDKLTAMGLLPQDTAMGARMMMGLFTVPGDAPDTVKSRVEFSPEGQILANGQRIR